MYVLQLFMTLLNNIIVVVVFLGGSARHELNMNTKLPSVGL